MSFIGKAVYKIWATNALLFGNVTAEKTKDGWKYVRVDWKDDEAYKMDVARVIKLRNVEYDEQYEWHRIILGKSFNHDNILTKAGASREHAPLLKMPTSNLIDPVSVIRQPLNSHPNAMVGFAGHRPSQS